MDRIMIIVYLRVVGDYIGVQSFSEIYKQEKYYIHSYVI
jgi:hypothetical protein